MQVINCAICDHVHAPSAHNNHCPACGCGKMVILGQTVYVNVANARVVTATKSWFKTLKQICEV